VLTGEKEGRVKDDYKIPVRGSSAYPRHVLREKHGFERREKAKEGGGGGSLPSTRGKSPPRKNYLADKRGRTRARKKGDHIKS